MSLESLAAIFLVTPNGSHQLTFSCARCLSQITAVETDGRVRFACAGGCTEDEVIGALAEVEPKFGDWLNGGFTDDGRGIEEGIPGTRRLGVQEHPSSDGDDNTRFRFAPDALETQTPRQDSASEALVSNERSENERTHNNEGYNENTEPHLNGQVSERRPDLQSWKMVLYAMAQTQCEKAIKEQRLELADLAAFDDEAWAVTVRSLRHNSRVWQTNDPDGLSETEIDEELMTVAVALRKHYAPAVIDQNGAVPARSLAIVCENAAQAMISNAEYLSHPAIIERLYYTHHISLGVGGKHEGKTTATRSEAMAIALGREMYGRSTIQMPVVYAVSDDEYPTTRMELLKMGWNPAVPLELVRIAQGADPDNVLEDIAQKAHSMGSNYVVLDMLFDFTNISDELKYAHTRAATGKVQQLADAVNGHVRSTHHSPKWMPDAASAAKAALGSQGIAARFSPILLSRQFTRNLFTIESTMTRDPRGAAILPMKVVRDELGWLKGEGEFKEWMKWELYSERVMAVFEGGDRKEGRTVYQMARDLEIDRARIQNTMFQLEREGKLRREKAGRSFKYYLADVDLFDRKGGQFEATH